MALARALACIDHCLNELAPAHGGAVPNRASGWPHRHLAAAEGSYSAVSWLLQQGCDVNPIDRFKRTPLEVGRAVQRRWLALAGGPLPGDHGVQCVVCAQVCVRA